MLAGAHAALLYFLDYVLLYCTHVARTCLAFAPPSLFTLIALQTESRKLNLPRGKWHTLLHMHARPTLQDVPARHDSTARRGGVYKGAETLRGQVQQGPVPTACSCDRASLPPLRCRIRILIYLNYASERCSLTLTVHCGLADGAEDLQLRA